MKRQMNESSSAALALLRGCSIFRRVIFLCIAVLCVASAVSAQSPESDAPLDREGASADPSGEVAEVFALEAKIAEAIVGGDVTFVDSVTPADFRMTHGDTWTRGGQAALVDASESGLVLGVVCEGIRQARRSMDVSVSSNRPQSELRAEP